MTTSSETPGTPIPDFEKDAQSIAAYHDAKVRYERREMQDAEAKVRAQFATKREAIRAEIASAGMLFDERYAKWQKALGAYAARYPKNFELKRALKPSFWQSALSMGAASRMFRAIGRTNADVNEAQTLRRRREHDEEELENQLKRALFLQEDSFKKRLLSPEGIEAFNRRPGVAVLWQRVQEIQAEREAYAARLERGEVGGQEQRDRDWAERKIERLELPFAGLMIAEVKTYGDRSYFLLRDLTRKLFALPYDPRLEPLMDQVVDVFRIADSFEAKLHRGADGKSFTSLDHFFTCYKDEEVARFEWRKQRTALRNPRTLEAMTVDDPNDQAIIDILAKFAPFAGMQAPSSFAPPQA
jgi:hypothetical protein